MCPTWPHTNILCPTFTLLESLWLWLKGLMINTGLGLGVTLTFFSACLSKQVELPHVVLILHHATTHCVQNCKYSILPERSPEMSPGAGAPLHLKSLRLGGDAAGNCW